VIVEFDKSFEKSIDKIKDKSVFPKIEKLIINLENTQTIKEVKNIKKLSGFKTYHRIRLGVYWIGLKKITDSTL
jgi:mRNA interferase RelE/StbE